MEVGISSGVVPREGGASSNRNVSGAAHDVHDYWIIRLRG